MTRNHGSRPVSIGENRAVAVVVIVPVGLAEYITCYMRWASMAVRVVCSVRGGEGGGGVGFRADFGGEVCE